MERLGERMSNRKDYGSWTKDDELERESSPGLVYKVLMRETVSEKCGIEGVDSAIEGQAF